MRNEVEVQAVHDMLEQLLHGEIPHSPIENMIAVKAVTDVLCWVLEHDHDTFRDQLQRMRSDLEDLGYELHSSGGWERGREEHPKGGRSGR